MGYLQEGLRNYLLRLGWAHGDEEFFDLDKLEKIFSFKGMGKSPSRFDFAKLENMNGHYIRQADDARLVAGIKAILPEIENGSWFQERWTEEREQQLLASMPGLKERAKTLLELADGARFIFDCHPLPFEDKALAILDAEDGAAREVLAGIHSALAGLEDWAMEPIEEAVREFAEENELKLGKVAQPLRAALTGRTTSPGIFDVVWVLGRDEALVRISAQMK